MLSPARGFARGTMYGVRHLGVRINVIFSFIFDQRVQLRGRVALGREYICYISPSVCVSTKHAGGRPTLPPWKRSCRATSEEQKHDSCRAITAPWSLTNSFVFIFYTWLFLRFPNYSNMFSLQLLFSKKTNIFVWFSNNYRPACDRWRVFMWHLTEGLLRSRIHDIVNKLLFNILQS